MSFGITLDGFTIKRLSDILEEIEEDQIAAFGTLDHSASSVLSQLNGTFSKQCSDIWEVLQGSYLSSSPSNAEGLSLDYVVAQNNIERLPAISTLVEVALRGSNGTLVPEGTQISWRIYYIDSSGNINNTKRVVFQDMARLIWQMSRRRLHV